MQEQFHLHTLQCLSFLISVPGFALCQQAAWFSGLLKAMASLQLGFPGLSLQCGIFALFQEILSMESFEAIPAVACDPLQEILPQNHQLDLCSKSAIISFPYYPKCLFWLQNPVIPTLPLARRIFSFSSGHLLECQGCAGPTATIVLTSCDTVSLKSSWN